MTLFRIILLALGCSFTAYAIQGKADIMLTLGLLWILQSCFLMDEK